jgi:uncharacterized damage-inducible protein DinB
MQAGEYQSLLRHMEWADAAVWKAVLNLPAAQKDTPLLERLYHLHTVQRVYLQVWRRESIQVPEASSFTNLPALADWTRANYQELHTFAQGLASETLSRTLEFPWSREVIARLGSAGPATLGESVLQVALHSAYHRGQVATRIRELGGEPPLTDFIAWTLRARPDPEW